MLQSYDDILAIAAEARRPIGWWDENGVPRFAPHHPNHCPDIYATEVVLLLIACQACLRPFRVQMSWSMSGAFLGRVKAASAVKSATGIELDIAKMPALDKSSLAGQVRDGIIHYGDPPHHECSGVSMNCHDVRVLEFWSRNRPVTGAHDWMRIADLEIQLPDADEIEGAVIP